jgi:oxygen-independent coproporphyrinogen-3 oxidase
MAGLYLHIPFCKQACHYCDFHFSTKSDYADRMVAAMVGEIALRHEELDSVVLDSVYFGGGTPSLLSERQLNEIFESIFKHFSPKVGAEITLEANPDDLTRDKVRQLAHSPVNRLSMGIQSFHEAELKLMNRAHNAREARAALDRVFDSGFTDITADLIFGMPGSSLSTWAENLEEMLRWPMPHLSCYSLTVEPRTALHHQVQQGRILLPDEEVVRSQFYHTIDFLAARNMAQYELSNFALPGHEAAHNSAYWHGKPYLGIGPSANSYTGAVRKKNLANNAQYMKSVEAGQPEIEIEQLSDTERANESIMTALRLREGLQWDMLHEQHPHHAAQVQQAAKTLIEKGWLDESPEGVRLAREGKIMADRVMMELFVD